jgi:hypothetical protein
MADDIITLDDLAKMQPPPAPAPQAGGSAPVVSLEDVARMSGTQPPQAPETWGEYGSGLAGAISHGATFGFADELKGAVQGGLAKLKGEDYGPTYERVRDAARNEHKQFAERHPGQAIAGEVYGGLGPATRLFSLGGKGVQLASRLLPEASSIPGLSSVVEALPSWLKTGAGYATEAAVPGAVAGGVQGFGEGEGGFENRVQGAVTGAEFGAPAGLVVRGGLDAAGIGARGVVNAAGFGNPETRADQLISRSLQRDKVPVDELGTRVQGAQEPMILPDLAGRNTVQLGAAASRMPGPAQEVADQVVQARRAGGPDRMATTADTTFGGGGGDDVAQARDALMAQRSADAAPLYTQAFQATVQQNPDLKRMLGMPEIQKGIQRGLDIQRIEAGATGQPSANSGPQLLDAGKRGLDDMLEQYRDKTTGRLVLDEQGRALQQLRQSFVAATDQAVPELAAARQAWAGPSSALDAIDRGKRAFSQDRDIVETANQRLSPADADFYRLGAGRAFTDRTSDPRNVPEQARKLLEDKQMQGRLDTLIPDPAQRQAFNEALQREVTMANTNRAISPRAGSQTTPLAVSMADTNAGAGNVVDKALEAGIRGGKTGMISSVVSDLFQRSKGLTPEVGQALAARLFTSDPTQLHGIVDRLQATSARQLSGDELRRTMMARALLSSGGNAHSVAAQLGL